VSYLQVLAILSFERKNHQALKKNDFIVKLENNKMFSQIFDYFESQVNEEKRKQLN
jgi:hypothetical protein